MKRGRDRRKMMLIGKDRKKRSMKRGLENRKKMPKGKDMKKRC